MTKLWCKPFALSPRAIINGILVYFSCKRRNGNFLLILNELEARRHTHSRVLFLVKVKRPKYSPWKHSVFSTSGAKWEHTRGARFHGRTVVWWVSVGILVDLVSYRVLNVSFLDQIKCQKKIREEKKTGIRLFFFSNLHNWIMNSSHSFN